jgi:hypothetical protein
LEQAAAVQAAVVEVAPAVPKVEGQNVTKRWKAVVTDPRALIAHIVANWDDWQAYVEIKQGALDSKAGRTKGLMTAPGVKCQEVTGIASRGR